MLASTWPAVKVDIPHSGDRANMVVLGSGSCCWTWDLLQVQVTARVCKVGCNMLQALLLLTFNCERQGTAGAHGYYWQPLHTVCCGQPQPMQGRPHQPPDHGGCATTASMRATVLFALYDMQ